MRSCSSSSASRRSACRGSATSRTAAGTRRCSTAPARTSAPAAPAGDGRRSWSAPRRALRVLYETERAEPAAGAVPLPAGRAPRRRGRRALGRRQPPRLARADAGRRRPARSPDAARTTTASTFLPVPRRRALDRLGPDRDRRRHGPDLRDDAARPPPGGARGRRLPLRRDRRPAARDRAQVVATGGAPPARPGLDPDHGRRARPARRSSPASRRRRCAGAAVATLERTGIPGGGRAPLGDVFEPARRTGQTHIVRRGNGSSGSTRCSVANTDIEQLLHRHHPHAGDGRRPAGERRPSRARRWRSRRSPTSSTRRSCDHNPANPHWPDRDRFVLSAGHACILQYARSTSPATTSRSRS